MNRLSAILPAPQVLVSVDATSKKRAFEEAGLLFETLHGLNRALITDSLFARERLGSTGLGHGVAIPHGRIKGLKQPLAAVFQLANPIGFDAPDEQPVQLMINGDANDNVQIAGSAEQWQVAGSVEVDGTRYDVYNDGDIQLLVASNVHTSFYS